MMSQKSQVKRRKLKVLTGDLRPSTFDPPLSSDLRPATCDLRLSTRSRAFTLIELVVTIVIMGIMALVTVQYLVSASQVYVLLLAQRQADSELMDAVGRMRREARTARSTLTATTDEWSFVNVQGQTNTFHLTGHEVILNGNNLARGVDRFLLTYYNNTNGVATNQAAIDHVELSFKVTNDLAASELIVNFFLRKGFLK